MAIREGREPTRDQLVDLEHVLRVELTGPDIGLTPKGARQAYQTDLDGPEGFLGFAGRVLDLVGLPDYRTVVTKAFEEHIASHGYTGDQLRFLRAVQDVFLQQKRISEADLYEPPLSYFGRNAADRLFNEEEKAEIISLGKELVA